MRSFITYEVYTWGRMNRTSSGETLLDPDREPNTRLCDRSRRPARASKVDAVTHASPGT